MSQEAENSTPAKGDMTSKIAAGLAGGALIVSLANTAILLTSHTAEKIEQAGADTQTLITDSGNAILKKIDLLHTSGSEWQAVLKGVADKPDATYKIVKSPDGLLTLTEILPAEAAAAPAPEAKH